ncbi:MAG TPA: hypothetical protein VKY31_08880, partial [Terriglobia bacterium]|nr:hypothetical protein [Terriglobia bacterium]
MDLNAATLTPNPTDILSLIPLIGNNPVASTNSSVSPAQSFSALLTEMTGPVQTSQPVVPAPTVAAPVVSAPSAPAPVAIAPADQPVAVAPVSVPAPQE